MVVRRREPRDACRHGWSAWWTLPLWMLLVAGVAGVAGFARRRPDRQDLRPS